MSARPAAPAPPPAVAPPAVATPPLVPTAMRLLRFAVAAALTVAGPAAAQGPNVLTFDAIPTAAAAGAFAGAGGYTFVNFATLEAASTFGTGANAVSGARFAYVLPRPDSAAFGSVYREDTNWNLFDVFLSFRSFDGNTAPLAVTVNGYRGFDDSAPVFTRDLVVTNAAQRFTFNWGQVSEVEFVTNPAGAGRSAVLALDDLSVTVPEPATVTLVGAGAVAVLAAGARRRRTG